MEDVEASGKTVDEAVARALQQLGLDRSQVEVEVVSEGRRGPPTAALGGAGDGLGIPIGRRGSTVAALQYMVNHMVSRSLKTKALVSVDVERYKRRREEALIGLAQRLADTA